ncbi:MAG: hypothetical protein GX589_10620 [Deltaproteobacteria bacterium]|nr:hypothetical protein [Deltaproteobacteria bacterium]
MPETFIPIAAADDALQLHRLRQILESSGMPVMVEYLRAAIKGAPAYKILIPAHTHQRALCILGDKANHVPVTCLSHYSH